MPPAAALRLFWVLDNRKPVLTGSRKHALNSEIGMASPREVINSDISLHSKVSLLPAGLAAGGCREGLEEVADQPWGRRPGQLLSLICSPLLSSIPEFAKG